MLQEAVTLDEGEDNRSITQHVTAMKVEFKKMRHNLETIRHHLQTTLKYRTKYIQDHTTAEVLVEFPCLSIPFIVSSLLLFPPPSVLRQPCASSICLFKKIFSFVAVMQGLMNDWAVNIVS